jgi:hypothetical protein
MMKKRKLGFNIVCTPLFAGRLVLASVIVSVAAESFRVMSSIVSIVSLSAILAERFGDGSLRGRRQRDGDYAARLSTPWLFSSSANCLRA